MPYRIIPPPRIGIDTRPASRLPPAARSVRNLSYGPTSWEKLDVYLPDANRFPGARPVLVWLHSGGWISGTRLEISDVIRREVGRGFALASVDYALAPAHPFPAPLRDIKLAIRWLEAHSTRFRFDPAKVILAGGSSGGHLASLAAVSPGKLEPHVIPAALRGYDDTVAAVVDFVGPTNMYAFDHETRNGTVGKWARSMGAALLGCVNPPSSAPMRCPAGSERSASVAPYLSRGSPPVYMAYGALDSLVPPKQQAIPLAHAWALLKGTNAVWVEILSKSGHNVSIDTLNNTYFDRFLDGVVNGSIH